MRILMLSWEYPPNIVGGLGAHVGALAPALARRGAQVYVVTSQTATTPPSSERGNLHIIRVPTDGPMFAYSGYYDQVLRANVSMSQTCSRLRREVDGFDLVHNHDWLTSFAAREIKHLYHVPLVATIHATEKGRGRGTLGTDQALRINEAEWHLTYDAWRVICCTDYMAREVSSFFDAPADKIDVIPNGIDANRFAHLEGQDLSAFRAQYVRPHEKLILYVGRMVYEKGGDILVRAARQVISQVPEARFVIAGRGPELDHLRELVDRLDLREFVNLAGFVDDDTRDKLYMTADCAVFPSRYEPFGIVALEAMAAHTPVVASDVGGLREVVRHAETGITTYADSPESCAWGIVHTLEHPEWTQQRVANAYRALLERFSWDTIAAQTLDVYQRVLEERAQTDW